ncbi:hypothetical protein ACH5RR_025676 [Cinchona calisaya]|uniref:Uncharacterized protein n=1 Tax=Cinchona calisaya TaxID=153742 RepID=A0ABD2Z1F3_9GENT
MSRLFSPLCPSIEYSNLQGFLHSTVPVVPSKLIPRTSIQDTNNGFLEDKDTIEYFTLGDLWRSFDEWSAYGVGIPVVLGPGRSVVQYYAPYLSAIQIYTPTRTSTILRNLNEEDADVEMEFWSDGNESDMLTRSLSNNSSKNTWDITSGDSNFDHESSWPTKNTLGYLYFQYHDVSSPYWRTPIADKIRDFKPNYPGLVSLKSFDLSPASWMSLAWYPVYQIPTKWYVKDLATRFLTYHTLSSCYQDHDRNDVQAICSSEGTEEPKEKLSGQFALPPFGMATYKLQGDVWINQNAYDQEKLNDLQSAADSWLKQLNFHHHDFHFFMTHY